jgi:sugar lactone lactonase YvrE
VYVGDLGNELIRKITSAGVVSTFAGKTGVAGNANGQGTAASFSHPQGVAVDASGNLYVADTVNNLIRLITPSGLVSTFAGSGSSGSQNGSVGTATFAYPYAVAVDSSGNVYVSDNTNNLIRKISGGVVSTLAGQAGVAGATNATGTNATFSSPGGVAVDSAGNIYVADSGNHLIRIITPGGVVSTFAGEAGVSGYANGPALSSTFGGADGVAVDQSGNVFVADTIYNQIREISNGTVSTLAGSRANGSANGLPSTASFDEPWGIAVDTSENVYVGDAYNDIIRKIEP